MAINVVCSGCMKRFSVDDKFAGKKGPCPKCKTVITIPAKAEEVVVHAPQEFGPKDSKGRGVLKPIFRSETKFNPVMAGAVAGTVLLVLLVTWLLRSPQGDVPTILLMAGAILLAPPIVFGGYTFFRDDELEAYQGTDLWLRVGVCGLVYALLWAFQWLVNVYVLNGDGFTLPGLGMLIPVMVLAGAGIAHVTLDLDYFISIFHYGVYFAATVVLRVIIGVGAFPIDK